jgi:hypothetical protein
MASDMAGNKRSEAAFKSPQPKTTAQAVAANLHFYKVYSLS